MFVNVKRRKSKKSSTSAEIEATPPARDPCLHFGTRLGTGGISSSVRAHLSQDPSFCGVEVEKITPEKILIQHQLFPRGRRDVAARTAARQRDVLHSVPGYPASARGDIVQALIVARRYVVDGLRGAPAGLLRRCIRIIRALQIHVGDTAAAAEDVRHALHDASLPAAWKANGRFINVQSLKSEGKSAQRADE